MRGATLNLMVNPQPYDLDLIFRALADPTRRAMLRSLSSSEKPITEVAEPHNMSLAAVSKHVKVLEKAGLVRRRREGSFSYLSLNGAAMKSADDWIEQYAKLWEARFDALERFLETEKAGATPRAPASAGPERPPTRRPRKR